MNFPVNIFFALVSQIMESLGNFGVYGKLFREKQQQQQNCLSDRSLRFQLDRTLPSMLQGQRDSVAVFPASLHDPNLSRALLVLNPLFELFVVVIELYLIVRVELTKTTKNFPRNLWWLTLVGIIFFFHKQRSSPQ